ncbi:MAG: hypothetical protein AAF404_17735 [Pseudomonadota bacterium]
MIDRGVSRDIEELNFVAAKFDTTEFEIFGLAFYDCHGYRADELSLQDMFMEFLHGGDAPQWLKNYVKRRVAGDYELTESIRQSAFITTGASSAIVKWRPSVDIFSFTLISAVSSSIKMFLYEK